MKKYNYEFDEQTFVETYLPDFGQNDDIAVIDDICCLLDNDYDDSKREYLVKAGYFDLTRKELVRELNGLERKVLEEAFQHYLDLFHPIHD